MEHVDVYRVEKRGRGPFGDHSLAANDCMNIRLPTPSYDSGFPEEVRGWDIANYRFGAPTIDSMKDWITKPNELSKRGYKVSLYKAKKKYVYASTIQSMFIKRHAKKVKEWTVEEFCSIK